jgi:hypothetical protein
MLEIVKIITMLIKSRLDKRISYTIFFSKRGDFKSIGEAEFDSWHWYTQDCRDVLMSEVIEKINKGLDNENS